MVPVEGVVLLPSGGLPLNNRLAYTGSRYDSLPVGTFVTPRSLSTGEGKVGGVSEVVPTADSRAGRPLTWILWYPRPRNPPKRGLPGPPWSTPLGPGPTSHLSVEWVEWDQIARVR